MSAKRLLTFLLLACAASLAHADAAPNVVVSIAPLHALVAALMEGVAEPKLLIPAGASHHAFTLRPSDVRSLHSADLVIWIGRPLERFLVKPLATLDRTTVRLAVAQLPDIKLLNIRQGGGWSDPALWGRDDGHTIDPHLWLDIDNGCVIVRSVAARLAAIDAAHAERYKSNAKQTLRRLTELDAELKRRLEPLRGVPYVVFHDAYQYLEERYGLHPVGAITTDPEIGPGAQHIMRIRELIRTQHVRCVFSEPQFQPALVQTVLEDSDARRGVLDPIGANIPGGSDGYFRLMNHLVDSLVGCLSPP
jgi:zinc transport system substrate-binding protein